MEMLGVSFLFAELFAIVATIRYVENPVQKSSLLTALFIFFALILIGIWQNVSVAPERLGGVISFAVYWGLGIMVLLAILFAMRKGFAWQRTSRSYQSRSTYRRIRP